MKNKTYLVRYTQRIHVEVRVKASNRDSAIDKADKILDSGETERITFRAHDEPEVHSVEVE